VLANTAYPDTILQLKDAEEAARTLGLQIHVVTASGDLELERAFASLVQRRVGALLLTSDLFLTSRANLIVELGVRHALPTMYSHRDFAISGGLMSYAPSFTDAYRLAGVYTGRILKGDKPADLPIVQSTKFDFVINLKTARVLGLTIPPGVLAIADEVIE
jgi:putative ABC transport system substrate-binding protein